PNRSAWKPSPARQVSAQAACNACSAPRKITASSTMCAGSGWSAPMPRSNAATSRCRKRAPSPAIRAPPISPPPSAATSASYRPPCVAGSKARRRRKAGFHRSRGRRSLRAAIDSGTIEMPSRFVRHTLVENLAGDCLDTFKAHAIAPEPADMGEGRIAVRYFQKQAALDGVAQPQSPIAEKIDVDHLDIRSVGPRIIEAGERCAHFRIAPLVVNGGSLAEPVPGAVGQMEEAEVADQRRAQILQDEGFVAVVLPRVDQRNHRIAVAGNVGEPVPVLGGRLRADALDILHHGKAKRIRIDAGIAPIVEARLEDDIGMARDRK